MKLQSCAKNIAVSALMAALLISGKFALSFVPNVEVVTLFLLLFSAAFGLFRTLPAVLVFCAIDKLIYTATPDVTIQYFVHYPLFCLIGALVGRKTKNEYVFFGIALLASTLFWLETPAIGWALGYYLFVPTMIAGIPFFAINLISNGAIILVLFHPLVRVMGRIQFKMFSGGKNSR